MNFNAPVGRHIDKVDNMEVEFHGQWQSWKNNPPPMGKTGPKEWIVALWWNDEVGDWVYYMMFWDDSQNAWAHVDDGATNLKLDWWTWLPKIPS